MNLRIEEIKPDRLSEYASVPMKFEVRSVFVVEEIDGELGGLRFREEKVDKPYIKDYDSYEGGPERWLKRFDVSNWGFLVVFDPDQPVGGATIAYNAEDVHMLEGRSDLAVLWDIRVHPDYARQGIGTMLFNYVVKWAKSRNCTQIKIETQNVNVPACRFYAKQGCHLGQINRYGYFGDPKDGHEVMLIWYLDL